MVIEFYHAIATGATVFGPDCPAQLAGLAFLISCVVHIVIVVLIFLYVVLQVLLGNLARPYSTSFVVYVKTGKCQNVCKKYMELAYVSGGHVLDDALNFVCYESV